MASVLLMVCGERVGTAMLERMSVHHLRDCTRPTLDPVLHSLARPFPGALLIVYQCATVPVYTRHVLLPGLATRSLTPRCLLIGGGGCGECVLVHRYTGTPTQIG